jgi:acylphosphatase
MSKRVKDIEAAALIAAEGLVQGVGFRRYVQREARAAKLAGFVENMKDGSVKVFVQGKRGNIEEFVEKVKAAPRPMEVESVAVKDSRPRPALKFFQIKSGTLTTEFQEGLGGMEAEFSDYRGEFRGFVGEFRDYREEFRDYREEFRDHRQEFRSYRKEFGEFSVKTQENFDLLGTKYGEISAKLTQILHELQTENRDAINSLNTSVDALLKAVEKLGPAR